MSDIIDPLTGLPFLPPGYRWRVTKASRRIHLEDHDSAVRGWVNRDFLEVIIQEEGEETVNELVFLFFPRRRMVQTWTTVSFSEELWESFVDSTSPQETITALAEKALAQAERIWKARARERELNGYLGAYPPKNLEGGGTL